MRTSATGAANQAVPLLSEVLQRVSGEAAEAAAKVARGVLSGVEPSSEAGCVAKPLSEKLRGKAGEAAQAAANVVSGELRSNEQTSEEEASSSVELPSAASQAALLLSEVLQSVASKAAEAVADVAHGRRGNCEPTSKDGASLSVKLPSAAGDATKLQGEMLLS